MSTHRNKKQKKSPSKTIPQVHYLRIQSISKQTHNIYFQPLIYYYPVLRLWGKWLETAGFSAGSQVSVTVTNKRMVIRKIEN